MSDVEWYLESNGVRQGPFSARQIIEMMNSGKIALTANVTTARMQGDWVTVKDLAEAYAELNPKKSAPKPASPGAPSTGESFQAPPRPVAQLEASKIIVLNPEAQSTAPDPTESLFTAVQSIREKKQAPPPRDRTGESSRRGGDGGRLSPQTVFMGTLIVVVLIAIYGVIQLFSGSSSQPTATTSPTPAAEMGRTPVSRPTTSPRGNSGTLLSEGGDAGSAVRTAPPVPRMTRSPIDSYRRDDRAREERPAMGGGANMAPTTAPPPAPDEHFEDVEEGPEESPDGENTPNDAPAQGGGPRTQPGFEGGENPEGLPPGVDRIAPEEASP